MMIRDRAALAILATMAVVLTDRAPLIAQEPATSKGPAPASAPASAPAPVAKKKTEPARRVPSYFGQIGLLPEQRARIYSLQARHQDKIEALEKQIAAEKAEMLAGCEATLTDTQKKLLGNLRQAAAEGPARTAAAPAGVAGPVKPD